MIYDSRYAVPENYYLSGGSSKGYPITKQKKQTWKDLKLMDSKRAYPILKETLGDKVSIDYKVNHMADMVTQTIEPHEYPDDL